MMWQTVAQELCNLNLSASKSDQSFIGLVFVYTGVLKGVVLTCAQVQTFQEYAHA